MLGSVTEILNTRPGAKDAKKDRPSIAAA